MNAIDTGVNLCYTTVTIRELDETQAERKSAIRYDFDR